MDIALTLITVMVVGLLVGGIGIWIIRGREISRLSDTVSNQQQQLSGLGEKAEEHGRLAAKAERADELEKLLGTTQAELGELKLTEARAVEQATGAAQQIATLTQVRTSMLSEFKVIAAETMKEHGQSVSKQNTDQIAAVLTPLREKITEFQQNLQSTHTESVKERAILAQQIKTLSEDSMKITTETENLTRALKGDIKTQGIWGEMKLATVFERCGLEEGEQYETQEPHRLEDGTQIRPDAIVHLPHKHCIVVDAKVSLTAYERYVNADSDADKASHLQQHVDSIKSHIEKLSDKKYWRVEGSHIDCVVMFVPMESALGAALSLDRNLAAFAVERRVAIATPTTLMIALRTVANLWRIERQNSNAQAIAERAGRLYDKFVGFIEDMKTLGDRLNAAAGCHAAAMNKLSTGQGNLIRQIELIKGMGAATIKALPKELIENDIPVAMLSRPVEEYAGVKPPEGV